MKPEAQKFWANSSSTWNWWHFQCFWHWTIVVKGSVEYWIAGPRCQGSTGCASGGGEGAPSSWSWTRRENQTGSGWSLGPHRGSAGVDSSGRPLDSITIGPRFEYRLSQAVNFFCLVKLDANESRSNFNFFDWSRAMKYDYDESGCGTALWLEHWPACLKTGFESCPVLGFFFIFPSITKSLHLKLSLNWFL